MRSCVFASAVLGTSAGFCCYGGCDNAPASCDADGEYCSSAEKCGSCGGEWCDVSPTSPPPQPFPTTTLPTPLAGLCCYGGCDSAPASCDADGDYCSSAERCGSCGGEWCGASPTPPPTTPPPTTPPPPTPSTTPSPTPVSVDRCDSERIPQDSRCSGCPPTYNGKLCASTTHYNDQTRGACGCGSSDPVPPDWWTKTQYTAALNCKNLDSENPLLGWCPGGCGGCYELCSTGGNTNGAATAEGHCHVFKIDNRCGDGFKKNQNWCMNEMSWQEFLHEPARCQQKNNTNWFGYSAHFDLQDFATQITVGEGWNNVEVTFEPVSCDLWDGPSWDCECASEGADLAI